MAQPLNDPALDQIFRTARTRYAWSDADVSDREIHAVYDLMKMGATSANCSPGRFLWLRTAQAKARIKPYMMAANQEKTVSAPWVCVIAWDEAFPERIPELFPHNPGAKDWFASPEARFDTGFRNGTLQAAYLMMAARALGLDCGPMSGFDRAGVEREFFHGDMASWKANFVCTIGHGTDQGVFPRLPRLAFEDACRVL
jgi:3-hydroxypropanoate dehydrogenase